MAKLTKTASPSVQTPTQTQPKPQPVAAYDWGTTGITGFENVNRDDLGIPFIQIVQKGSPEIDRTHPDFSTKEIKGVQVGDIVNTLTREILHKVGGTPMEFIPCGFEKLYMEWKPKNSGGGMIKAHRDPAILVECTRNDKGIDVHRNGNHIVTTAYFYGLFKSVGERSPGIISMTSTQLKKARAWLNLASSIKIETPRGRITPPIFSHSYHLSTVAESNDKGSWMGWKIAVGSMINDPATIADSIETSKRMLTQNRALPAPPETDHADALM
jgi:hypothetical protein